MFLIFKNSSIPSIPDGFHFRLNPEVLSMHRCLGQNGLFPEESPGLEENWEDISDV